MQFKEEDKTPWVKAVKRKPQKSGLYEFQCDGLNVGRPEMKKYTVNNWARSGGWNASPPGTFTPCTLCRWRGLAKDPNANT